MQDPTKPQGNPPLFNEAIAIDENGPGPFASPLTQYLQQMEAVTKKNNPYFQTPLSDIQTVPLSQTRRYDNQAFGYIDGIDNEDFYGQRQDGFEKLGNGLLKLAGYTVAKAGAGIGFLGGLVNPDNWFSEEGYLVSAADNAFSQTFEALEDNIRNEWAPTFQEASDRDKGFWARAFTDADFWSEDFVDGLAFMASAYVPGGALAKLGVGARIAKGLSAARVGVQSAAGIVSGVETAGNYLRQAAIIAPKIDKGLMWAAATASEAMVEAKGVKDYLTENLKDSGFDEEQKKEIIGGAMRNTFLMNAALLGVTNRLELDMFYKAFGKSNTVAKGIVQEGKLGSAFGLPKAAEKVGRLDKILQSPVTKFMGSAAQGVVREGFVEENMQLAIQRMNQEYGLAGRVATLADLGNLGSKYFSQTKKAIMGEDQEASLSIGLGGLLGGVPTAIGDMRQEKRDKLTTENSIKQLNLAQQNWLKFGNIYQTETIDVTDAAGNVVKQERLVLDENKRPIADIEKVNAIAASLAVNANLMTAAEKEPIAFNQRLMRDMAFGNFVNAHINAGIEDTLFHKLEEAEKAKPEELMSMGFDPTYDHKVQIRDYKQLAASIVKKNKLIQEDILFENTEEDQVRRKMLTDYVTQQAIYEKLGAQTLEESKELANEFLKPIAGVTTDSLVTQLNLLQQRIDQAKETLSDTKKGDKVPIQDQLTQQLIDELTTEKAELEQSNELTIKELSKKSGGYYSYQKRRGANPMLQTYRSKLGLHGALINEARLAGLKFAKFADTKTGQKNFEDFRNFIEESIIKPANEALDKADKERSAELKRATMESAPVSKTGKKLTVKYKVNPTDTVELQGEIQEGDRYERTSAKTKETYIISIVQIKTNNEVVALAKNVATGEDINVTFKPNELLSLRDREKWKKLESLPQVSRAASMSTATPAEVKEQKKDSNLNEDGIDPTLLPDDVGMAHSGIRPKWEEVKFNKTFGLHFKDKDDNIPNTEDGNDRFYRFTSKYSLLGGNYALMVITEDNDKLGLRRSDVNPKDIKLVLVRYKNDDTVEYIDENNQVIPDKKISKNNLVYTSMADIDNWTVDRVNNMYTVSSKTTPEEIQEEIDAHKAFQESLREQVAEDPDVPVVLNVDRVSPGVRKVERNLDGTFMTNPVEGRIVVDNPDWSDLRSVSNPDMKVALRISTKQSTIKGIKPGRAIMQEYKENISADGRVVKLYSDKVTQVFTRMMTPEEQDKYFKAVVRMTELMNKKFGVKSFKKRTTKENKWQKKSWARLKKQRTQRSGQKLSKQEEEEMNLLLTWLKGVSMWSKPGKDESKVRHIWIENGLHVGSELIKPPLTNATLEKNKKIILKEPYFNINRTLLINKKPFFDIKFVKGKVEAGEEFETYEKFLLAAREDGVAPPVYTSFPRYDSSMPQRKSAFIIWRNPEELNENDEDKQDAGVADKKQPVQFEGSVTMSRLDKSIADFADLKLNKVVIPANKSDKSASELTLERERLSDGSIKLHIRIKGTKKEPFSVTFPSEERFLANKNNLFTKITEVTGYVFGSSSQRAKAGFSLGEIRAKALSQRSMVYSEPMIRKLFQEMVDGKPLAEFTDDERSILADAKNKQKYKDLKPTDEDEEVDVIYPAEDNIFEDEYGDQFLITNDPGGVDGTEDVEWRNIKTGEEGAWTRIEFDNLVEERKLFDVTETVQEDQDEDTQDDEDEDDDAADDAPFDTGSKPDKVFTSKRWTTLEEAVDNAYVEDGKVVAQYLEIKASVPGKAVTPAIKNQLRVQIIQQVSVSDNDYRLALRPQAERVENFEEFQQFMNRALPQFMVNKVNQLIDRKAWGKFMNGAIYIYDKAEYGTGYHEAFEAVYKSYLTDAEIAGLEQEFRQREGTFFNPYSGQTKKYSEASAWDVKEMLADEFKDYIINNGKLSTQVKEKTKGFFKSLWKMITELFGMSTNERDEMESQINNVFKKINDGEYRRTQRVEPGEPALPIQEQGIVGGEESRVPGLSQKETSDIIEGLSYYFFVELFKKGKNIDTLLNSLSTKESNLLFIELYEQAYNNVEMILTGLESDQRRANLFRTHGKSSGEIYNRFKKRLEKYGVKFTEIRQEVNEDEQAERNPLGIVDSMSINPRKMTEANVQMLLATLPDIQYDAKNKKYPSRLNDMMLPRLVDADRVHNLMLNELSNIIPTYDENGNQIGVFTKMMQQLDLKYRNKDGTYRKGYEWIRNLKMRLKYADKDGNLLDPSMMTDDDVKLRVAFTKSFTNVRYVPSKLLIGEDGKVYSISPLMNTNEKRILDSWANKLKSDIQSKRNKMFTVDKTGQIVLNRYSDQFIELQSQKRTMANTLPFALSVLESLGITFAATEEDLGKDLPSGVSPKNTIIDNALSIFEVIEKGEITNINNIYSRGSEGKITGRINDLASIAIEYTADDNLLSYLNGDGEMQYAIGISSLYGNMVNTLNSVKNLKELVVSCPWLGRINDEGEVELHAYQSNSELLKPGGTLFSVDGKRNSSKLRYHVLTGTGMTEVDGINTAKLEYPERVALKISYLMNKTGAYGPIGFTVINSDKNNEFGLGLPDTNSVTVKVGDTKNLVDFLNDKKKRTVAESAEFQEKKTERILRKYRAHLFDEMAAAKAYYEQEDSPEISNYRTEVANLGHFKEILPAELHTKFKNEVLKFEEDNPTELGDITEFLDENQKEVDKAILDHLRKQIEATKELLLDNELFYMIPSLEETGYMTDAVDNERLRNFFSIEGNQQQTELEEMGGDGKWVDSQIRSYITPEQLDTLAAYLAINEELITTEQHKIVFGHPAMYSDIAKRASGSTATKQPIVEDSEVLQRMDQSMERMDGKVRSAQKQQTFKNISFQDVDVVSLFYKEVLEAQYKDYVKNGVGKDKAERLTGARFSSDGTLKSYILDKKKKYTGHAKAYMKMTEADAMAFILPDFTRDMLFLTSKWDSKMEKQWNYEMAYERLVRGGVIKTASGKTILSNNPAYRQITEDQAKADLALVKKGDPGYVFPVLKPQYFGYANTDGLMHPVFLKHSVQPKFYRHIEGTQFEQVYLASQKNQVDVIGFESGQKVGNVTTVDGEFVSLYNNKGGANMVVTKDEKGRTSYDLPEDLPQQDLFTRFYGIQVEQAPKTKKYTVRGTQVTKVVMTNFFENGKAIKDKSGKPNKEIQDTITAFNDTLNKMIRLGKENLLKELGLKATKKGYQVKDANGLVKLVSMLRKEAEDRELPDNVIDAIAVLEDGTLMYEFDTLINREKIDNILNSIVDSRVISEKLHGKSSVQVASTMYEFENRKFIKLNEDGTYEEVSDPEELDEEDQKNVRMASSDLKFYRNEKGQIKGMEVYIGWPFAEVTPEQLGLKLVNGVYRIPENGMKTLSPKLLEIMGFRIPTQGPNAIEAMTIKGFTPATNGDMIVVPSEIVGKAGSDFDIDKLYLYLPHYDVFIGDRAFGSPEFREFMTKDLMTRGMRSGQVKTLIKNLKKEHYEAINYAAFDEEARERYNTEYSLEGLPSFEGMTLRDKEFVKRGIMAFKSEYKGYKELRYIQPDDTTVKGLQNKFIELNRKLILHEENYAQLTVPNSTATLKALADEIRTRKEQGNPKKIRPDEKSAAFLRSFVGSLSTRQRYILAKRMVGISALHTTFHTMAQVAGLRLNGDKDYAPGFLTMKNDEGKPITSGIQIKLDHHKPNPDGTYEVGHRFDTDKIRISDAFSEATSGFVDGAKDPFVFDLNFSLNTAGTWFYLKHLGVPEDQIAYFMNQPILDNYFSAVAKNKSSFKKVNNDSLYKEDLFLETIAPYYSKLRNVPAIALINSPNLKVRRQNRKQILKDIDTIYKAYSKFDLQEMRDGIIRDNLYNSKNKDFNPAMQIAVLASYLRYEAQSQKITGFLQAITYDTQATKTIQENRYQEARWKRIEQDTIFANPGAILESTFLGEMKTQKEDIPNVFRQFFLALDPRIQEVFEPLYSKLDDPDFFLTKDDALALLNQYQNHVLNYILHTTKFRDVDRKEKTLNSLYEEMFLGENTIAMQLDELQKSDDPMIANNLFIKELLPIMPTTISDPNIVSMFRNRLDTYDINNIIESLDNLRDYAKSTANRKLLKFTDDLTKFAIIQNGVGTSMVDFKKVLSVDTYTNLVKTIFDTFKRSNTRLNPKQVWRTFHQNNYTKRSIVPKAPKWAKVQDKTLRMSENGAEYYVKYLPSVSKEKLSSMLKNKENTKDVYKPVLFEKTDSRDENGSVIYIPIDVLGDGRNAVEIYTSDEQQSVFTKNRLEKVFGSAQSKEEGWSPLFAQETPVDLGRTKTEAKYLGGKNDNYSAQGAGTAKGDGKDAAMRKDADSIVVELSGDTQFQQGDVDYDIEKDELGSSTSETSLLTVALKNDGNILRDKVTHVSLSDEPNVVMLARSRERQMEALSSYTKQVIKSLHQDGATFIVGDAPRTDEAYVKYLEEIGATYNIYYTGKTNRLQSLVDTYEAKRGQKETRFDSLEDALKKRGKKVVYDVSEVTLKNFDYNGYKLLVAESNKKQKLDDKPMSQTMFDKLPESKKQKLFKQLKDC